MQFASLLYDQAQHLKPAGLRFRDLADELRGAQPIVPVSVPQPPASERTEEATWQWLEEQMKVAQQHMHNYVA